MRITILETHLQLIDRIVSEGTYGKNRDEVLNGIALEHAKYILSGGGPHDTAEQTIREIVKPEYGAKRDDFIIQPVTGKAIPVHKGEVLRIVQVLGGQAVDFNGYNLHDYKEHLSCGFNRAGGISAGKGTIVWSGSPRGRPMYAILDCSEPFDQYFEGHRCTGIGIEMSYGFIDHPNCQDTFAEAIREFGLTPDDVHTSYNFFTRATLNSRGRRQFYWNRARKGDFVDMLALFDTLSVPVICGSGSAVNNYDHAPVQVNIFEASPATLDLVNLIQERLGRYKSQKTPNDFKLKEIRIKRKLDRDPNYNPEFIPAPRKVTIDLNLSNEGGDILQSLMRTGIYGSSEEKALVACFMRWYNVNRLKDRLIKLEL